MMIQGIDAGMAGGSAWDLDDAMHVGGQYGSQNLKQWGFWNSLGGKDGYPASDLALRPWYYPWSVLARAAFPLAASGSLSPTRRWPDCGSQRPRSRATAGTDVLGRRQRLRLAAVDQAWPCRRRPAGDPGRYDYFGNDRPVDANGFPVPANVLHGVRFSAGVSVDLPSRGMSF